MSDPIIYMDRSRIAPGRAAELRERIGELAALVEAREPRLLSYQAFFDPAGTAMAIVHVQRDNASLGEHLQLVQGELVKFRDLVELESITIFGVPDEAVREQLRQKARVLGREVVTIYEPQAGFDRFAPEAAIR